MSLIYLMTGSAVGPWLEKRSGNFTAVVKPDR